VNGIEKRLVHCPLQAKLAGQGPGNMPDEMVVRPLVGVIIHEGLWFTFGGFFLAGKG
jgi:hypothetical protein